MTEYGDAGGAPPEVEVEDNRPLQERIGDKVRASIKVVFHRQVLERHHVLSEVPDMIIMQTEELRHSNLKSMIYPLRNAHVDASSTRWSTLHIMVWC
jgi:hypothetical protein